MDKSRSILMSAKCPVCGKKFMPAPYHVYVEDSRTFCTWSCLCEYRRNKETKKQGNQKEFKHRRKYTRELRAEVIWMISEEHKTQKEAAEKFGLKYLTVNSWMKAYREGRLKL